MTLIYKAIPAILADIGHIGKDKECTQGARFKFRGIDDVYNAIHPLLATHKVFPTAKILDKSYTERESKSGGCLTFTKLTIEYTLWAEDGSSVKTEAVGEAMDSGDKSCNKAMSVAYKYALFQLLCIPTEAVDPDTEVHEPAPAKAALTEAEKLQVAEILDALPTLKTRGEYKSFIDEHVRNKSTAVQSALSPHCIKRRDELQEAA